MLNTSGPGHILIADMQQISQAAGQGCPLFLARKSLAVLDDQLLSLAPLSSLRESEDATEPDANGQDVQSRSQRSPEHVANNQAKHRNTI